MTKRKYERILLPFERYDRELRNNSKYSPSSELTISTIPKSAYNRKESLNNKSQTNRRRSTSPEIEIIPLKNGAMNGIEFSMDQINDMHKSKDYENHQYFNGGSNDGLSVPVHVIVRPTANGSLTTDFSNSLKRKAFDFEKLASSSRSFKSTAPGVQQKPKEKENIPLMLQNHTTIVPLTRDGVPTFSSSVVELDDSGDDNRAGPSHQAKKRKLDILREGGLEVTPISRRAQAESLSFVPVARPNQQVMQPNVSLMSLSPMRAPPVIQSLNMYQSTSQVFKNPKEDVMNATKSSKPICLDLTSKKYHPNDYHHQQQPTNMSRDNRKSQLSIEEVQRNYRGSNPDLQITLVKPQQEIPSSSSSCHKSSNGQSQKFKQSASKKAKNVPAQSMPGVPPLTPAIIAAANELQKLQQQNRPLFPFLNGLDITPMHPSSSSASPKRSSTPPALDNTLMSYFSAFYGNPLLQGSNLLSNIPAVEFLKFYNNSTASNSRIPSSKN